MFTRIIHLFFKHKCLLHLEYDVEDNVISVYCPRCNTPIGLCWNTDLGLHTLIFRDFVKFKNTISKEMKKEWFRRAFN